MIPPSQCESNPDVLIIGGGPAGSTAAALLARRGRSVVVLEKARHPRFHIGESLLPMNVPLLDRLGVLDEVKAIGVDKPGADFTCDGDDGEYRTYHFSRSLTPCPETAFEVRRSEFDHLLLENARREGARVLEEATVESVKLHDGGASQVVSRHRGGERRQWHPRYLLDASGRDAFLASTRGWKRRNRDHASAAIFGHFRGVARRPGRDAGNISIYWFDDGWIWMIPLTDDIVSVGAVCWPDYLKTRRGSLEDFLRSTIERVPAAHSRMGASALAGKVRAAGNYSYRAARTHGAGFALIGDAYAFVDPIFSSGVYLGMSSAERVVAPVEAWLNGDLRRHRTLMRRFARTTKRGLDAYSWFIYRFTTPAMRNLFKDPRNVLGVEQAVVSMLAGDVFSYGKAYWRLWVFRIIYTASYLLSWRDSRDHRRRRRANAHRPMDTSAFETSDVTG